MNHYFYPDLWQTEQIAIFSFVFLLYDIFAIGALVHIHHTHFKNCPLDSLKDFKNTCLLSESFLKEEDIEGDDESEPEINNGKLGGKFKSVLLDVNRQSRTSRAGKSISNLNTFETSQAKEYFGTEIDMQSECYDDHPELSLDQFNMKSIPGTAPDDSLHLGKFDSEF